VANLADGVVDVDGFGRGIPAGEVTLQVGVGEIWRCIEIKVEGNRCDDVAVAVRGVEDAVAIGEVALLGFEVDEAERFKIECANDGDAGRDLLPVGTDVLDRAAANQAGNAGETFDSCDTSLRRQEYESVPIVSGRDAIGERRLCRTAIQIAAVHVKGMVNPGMDNQAVEAAVADEEIAATTEDEDFEVVLARERNGFKEFGFRGDLAEMAGRAANAKGGERGERDLFLDVD
jgi:hypothetical protein